ncbi:MAG TPA: class I SAM-dependent methyltransferase [Smithellaceae bacterium]|nr:class I SAM-dependent methyltransferase [Smithellaceae bacterium]HPL65680.1 class I SAM-dependent methyltransferase [Smithellaceae bacterium]
MSDSFTVNSKHSAVFHDYARYYDLLYKDKDYEGEAEYVAGLIRHYNPDARSVLELGAGTGIHAMHLANRGYEVTGVEISADMLEIARSKSGDQSHTKTNGHVYTQSFSWSGKPVFLQGDIRNVRLAQTYDAVIALFHVISYQTTNEDVISAFKTARNHLKPGGIFIFDIWYGPAVLTQRPEVRIKKMSDDGIEVTRLAEPVLHPNGNRVDVSYRMFVRDLASLAVAELMETHFLRYFFYPEIELWAHFTGFTIRFAEEWRTAKPIGVSTWSVCFCLQAV